MSEKRHVARIRTSGKFVLQMLDFDGGVMWDIRPGNFGDIVMTVEHPDLPCVEEFQVIPEVVVFSKLTYKDGNLVKTERVSPPKTWKGSDEVREG